MNRFLLSVAFILIAGTTNAVGDVVTFFGEDLVLQR